MNLITVRDLIVLSPSKWRTTHSVPTTLPNGKTTQDIQVSLDALDVQSCSVRDVLDIVGDDLSWWFDPQCDLCDSHVEALAILSHKLNYREEHLLVCQTCLTKALSLFEAPAEAAHVVPTEVLSVVSSFNMRLNPGPIVPCPALPHGHRWVVPGQTKPRSYLVFHLLCPEEGWVPGREVGSTVDPYQCSTLYCAPRP